MVASSTVIWIFVVILIIFLIINWNWSYGKEGFRRYGGYRGGYGYRGYGRPWGYRGYGYGGPRYRNYYRRPYYRPYGRYYGGGYRTRYGLPYGYPYYYGSAYPLYGSWNCAGGGCGRPYYLEGFNQQEGQDENAVRYSVQFATNWGNDQSVNSPANPHTGNMFLTTGNGETSLFDVGQDASESIATAAMYGEVDDLVDDAEDDDNIYHVYTANVIQAPGKQNFDIEVTPDYPYLSFATMIAPSGDWFTGISNLNLVNDGQWIDNVTVPLYVYSAGTDSVQGFSDQHQPKDDADPISIVDSNYLYPDGRVKPIAYLVINRTQ
jgi:hypothetical protein